MSLYLGTAIILFLMFERDNIAEALHTAITYLRSGRTASAFHREKR